MNLQSLIKLRQKCSYPSRSGLITLKKCETNLRSHRLDVLEELTAIVYPMRPGAAPLMDREFFSEF